MGNPISFTPITSQKGVYGDFSSREYTDMVAEDSDLSIFSSAPNFAQRDNVDLYGNSDIDMSKYSDGISFDNSTSFENVVDKTQGFFSEGFSAGVNLFNFEKNAQNLTAQHDYESYTDNMNLLACNKVYFSYSSTF